MNVKPNIETATPVGEGRSHHLRPDEMPWQDTRFPGCKIKTLLFDPKSGLATMLFKMEPGAEIPDHEHVLIEQTYVLEGSLVDKEGPDAGVEVTAGAVGTWVAVIRLLDSGGARRLIRTMSTSASTRLPTRLANPRRPKRTPGCPFAPGAWAAAGAIGAAFAPTAVIVSRSVWANSVSSLTPRSFQPTICPAISRIGAKLPICQLQL